MGVRELHGFTGTRFYYIWADMKKRCTLKTRKDYHRYGGRGISFSKEWKSFINFKNDMYESYLEHVSLYGEKNTTLDRVENEKGYSVKNCRWATYREQANNQRDKSTQYYFIATSPSGEKFESNNQAAFGKEHNLANYGIGACLKGKQLTHRGWKFERKEG